MKNFAFTLALSFLLAITLNAQMSNGLYGNEWINYDQDYFKILVAEDGVYRIPYQTLVDAGVPVSTISGDQFQLTFMGAEIPVYVSSTGTLNNDSYLEFYGQRNNADVDRHMFQDPDAEMLNPYYSMFTDSSAYFLSWKSGGGAQFENQNNDLANAPAAEPYFMYDEVTFYKDRHIKKANLANISRSNFDMSQGWGGNWDDDKKVTYNTDEIEVSGPTSTVTVRLTGNNKAHNHTVQVNGTEYINEDFNGYEVKNFEFEVPNAELTDNAEILTKTFAPDNDRFSLGFVRLRYPRKFHFFGQKVFNFSVPASTSSKYLEIAAFDPGSNDPVLYDLTNGLRIVCLYEDNRVKVVLPPSTEDRNLVLVNTEDGYTEISDIRPTNFVNYTQEDAQFIIISSKYLMEDDNEDNPVDEYVNYRSTGSPVENYTSIAIEIQQLYDQFSYGINRHCIAVRNFGHYAANHWSDPRYVFMLGKAREYTAIRNSDHLAGAEGISYFLPTWGYPAADNLLLSTNESSIPKIPVSRVTATTPTEVRNYLDKVIAFEANSTLGQTMEDRGWMKRVMHLGGGDVDIQESIKGHLSALEYEITNNEFGGDVHSFFKTSSDPIQISQSDQITNLINTGVSILTFFGHSGPGSFDFSIDTPENYDNEDRYPIIVSLGCFSGHIHRSGKGISENFIHAKDRGSIGFFASRGFGYIPSLRNFAQEYYKLLGSTHYGQGIGDILKGTIENLDNSNIGGIAELVQQFTLNGDPAIRINPAPGPDYIIDASSVNFNPTTINVQSDSFEVKFDVVNLGRNTMDSVTLEVRQELPTASGSTILTIVNEKILAPANRAEFTYKIPVVGEQSVGLNKLYIRIDSELEVDELPNPMAESNNELVNAQFQPGVEFYIVSNDIRPLMPYEYAIVGDPNVTLKASTSNTFAAKQKYLFEIDTTALFNSPSKVSTSIEQVGGLVEWNPEVNFENEQVYYWRVSPDSIENIGYIWKTSSFVYIPNSPGGWNQSHYYQYANDRFINMELPSSNRKFKYLDDVKDIKIDNGEYPTYYPLLTINGHRTTGYTGSTVHSGVYVAVFDSITVDAWGNLGSVPSATNLPGGQYESFNNKNRTLYAFPYKTDNLEERTRLINFLENVVPSNNYVLFWTIQQPNFGYSPEDWTSDIDSLGTDLFQVLEAQGANLIRDTETLGSRPYAFFYKKDDPSYVGGEFLEELDGLVEHTFPVPGNWDSGSVSSTTIGPASSWTSFKWLTSEFESNNDFEAVDIYAIRADNTDSLMHKNLMAKDTTLAYIDAAEYPYLRLDFHSSDSIFRTSPQLDYWRVIYEGIPESALNPAAVYSLQSDTIQQGQTLTMDIAIENISEYDMDSLLVMYTITDVNNNEERIFKRLEPLLNSDTLIANLSLDTRNLSGRQRLQIEVNPANDQSEMWHFNNVALTEFYIEGDLENPILDVTFDGIHIMDGDIVSSRPNIMIRLRDENPDLPLADTSYFKILMKYPNEDALRAVYFNDPNLTFIPASSDPDEPNKASIEYNPAFLEDGSYQMFVQAEDASGNQSGDLDYKVTFEIVNQAMISNVLNYPNPFSTSTRFVYTLTGDEPPTFFKIQIMTVSGKIIKEITESEIGPLQIGTHVTDYEWDGRDEYGAKLANGVYLYRVVAKKANGEDYDAYNNDTDRYFKKGFGKLVILR